MKTLWVVSGGEEAVPGILHAKEMGNYVIVSDGSPDAPGMSIADESVLASTYDVDGTVRAATKYHRTRRSLDGVMAIAADVPFTVASVAAELNLPGISLQAAALATDKLRMKRRFADCGIPIPWFSPAESADHLRRIIEERGFPLVLKPTDSRGARGVLRLTGHVDIEWAFDYSLGFSPSKSLLVEEFLEGPQISTESIIVNGHGYTPGFIDRNYEHLELFSPYIIENGGQQPSELSYDEQSDVVRLAERAGAALGVTSGTVKGDIVMTTEGAKVLEMAPRLSGGWMATDQIPAGTGVDFVGAAVKLALAEPIDESCLFPHYRKGVAIRYFFPPSGMVKSIRHCDRFTDVDWIRKMHFFAGPGDMIEPVTNHTKRAGFVITVGADRKEAVLRAEMVASTVEFEID